MSFKGREYQERILKSEAPTIVVKKCSQVGISELMLMRNLALMDILNGFKIIHTLPTALFAQKVMKTRVDPLLASSPKLQSKLNKNLDNASVKQIGDADTRRRTVSQTATAAGTSDGAEAARGWQLFSHCSERLSGLAEVTDGYRNDLAEWQAYGKVMQEQARD